MNNSKFLSLKPTVRYPIRLRKTGLRKRVNVIQLTAIAKSVQLRFQTTLLSAKCLKLYTYCFKHTASLRKNFCNYMSFVLSRNVLSASFLF